jgi:hypothetical protein
MAQVRDRNPLIPGPFTLEATSESKFAVCTVKYYCAPVSCPPLILTKTELLKLGLVCKR